MQQQWTISPSDYNVWWKVDFIWQPAQWLDREETLKTLPKAKLALKKRSYSLFGGLLPIWSTTAFWIPAKPLYLRSMLSKSMRCTENCNTCSWHWSTEWAQFSTASPDHTSHNQSFRIWMNWAMKFCLKRHLHLTSCQLTTTSSSISTTFSRENASTTIRKQKMLSKSLSNPKAQIFTQQE